MILSLWFLTLKSDPAIALDTSTSDFGTEVFTFHNLYIEPTHNCDFGRFFFALDFKIAILARDFFF